MSARKKITSPPPEQELPPPPQHPPPRPRQPAPPDEVAPLPDDDMFDLLPPLAIPPPPSQPSPGLPVLPLSSHSLPVDLDWFDKYKDDDGDDSDGSLHNFPTSPQSVDGFGILDRYAAETNNSSFITSLSLDDYYTSVQLASFHGDDPIPIPIPLSPSAKLVVRFVSFHFVLLNLEP